MLRRLRAWARELKAQVLTLWYCRLDPRTPLAAKILIVAVVAYALSPIDLIPDFIPILGYLDDLILVPLGLYVAFKLVPAEVVAEARKKAEAAAERPGPSYVAAVVIAVIWIVLLGLLATSAMAAPNEIRVFTDELAAHGEHTLEVHANKTSSAGPKAEEPRTPLQLMPEYSYGFAQNWEASLQLPFSFPEQDVRLDGYRTELQYVAPHDGELGFYWGANAELAHIEKSGQPAFWSAELVAILGYRAGRWHWVANPAVERRLTGDAKSTSFTPAAKVSYLAAGTNAFGVEYYADATRGSARQEQSHMLFLAWDGKVGKSDLNVGVGRGLTDASDRWVLKMIYEIAF